MQTKRLLAGALSALLWLTAAGALELELEVRERGEDPPGSLTENDVDIRFDGKEAAVRGLRYVEGLAETKLYIGAEAPAQDFSIIERAMKTLVDELPEGLEVSIGGAPFTADRAELRAALALGVELAGRTPDAGLEKIWDFGQAYRIQGKPVLSRYALLASQLARIPGQKRVVIFRPSLELRQDGLDTREMNIRTGQLRQNDADMLRNEDDLYRLGTIAALSRVRFYPSNASTGSTSLDDQGLTSVARHTGGDPALGTGDPAEAVRIALAHLPGYYVATFDGELEGKGGRKSLKAEVRGKGGDAKFARDFLLDAPGLEGLGEAPEDLLSLAAADASLAVRAEHWVFRGADGRPMALISAGAPAAAVQSAKDGKGVAVVLALGAGFKNAEGWSSLALRVTRRVFDRKAFEKAQKEDGVTVDVAAMGALPGPGIYAWKTVLKDEESGAFGVLETEVGTHDLSRPMATSDVLITRVAVPVNPDLTEEPWGDLLDFGGSRLLPEPTREFRVGEPLLFTYRLYNAPAQMIANPPPVQLALFRNDQQLESFEGQGQLRVIEGKAEIQYVGEIQTKGLDPGDYLILSAVPGREDERQPYVEGAFRLVKK